MEIKLTVSKYRKGDEVYLYEEHGACLVTITDAYKWGNQWYYDIDASNYAKGFELQFVPEYSLGNKTSPNKENKPLSYSTMRRLYLEFKNLKDK